ncbi:MAG: hypothetical protein JXR07_12755 [Reichenbachiella sp.]
MGIFIIVYRNQFDTSVPGYKLVIFLIGVVVVSASAQSYLAYVLKLEPTENSIVYIVPNAVFLLSGLVFYWLFKKK